MKNEISSLELYYLMNELKVLENAKVDRVFHQKNMTKELTIGFHITGTGKKFLKIVLPSLIFLGDTKDVADVPTGLCMMLRKYLEGSRLKSIQQKDFERVIELTLDAKGVKYRLVIELFSKGNIIFCDENYKILNLLESQHWKDRELKKDEKYIFPKSSFNALEINQAEFFEHLNNSGKDSLVKALAIAFGLGGVYAEEICSSSGIDKGKKVKDVTEKDSSTMYKKFKELFKKDVKANFASDGVFPFELDTHKNQEKKYYASFCEAIEGNYDTIKDVGRNDRHNDALEKIQSIIDEQTKQLDECNNAYDENQSKGELLYEKYQEISKIMGIIKDARKKYSWKEIRQKINENLEIKKLVKDIDEKNSEIIIEMEK